MKPAGAIPEGPGSSAPKRMTPLNEGSRPTPGASSITSDGGEANLFILAEQPGDDARAGTVSSIVFRIIESALGLIRQPSFLSTRTERVA